MSFCDVMVTISELLQYMLLVPRLLRQVIVGYECQVTALYIEMVTSSLSAIRISAAAQWFSKCGPWTSSEHQYHLGTCYKCKFSGSDLLTWKLQGEDSALGVSVSLP